MQYNLFMCKKTCSIYYRMDNDTASADCKPIYFRIQHMAFDYYKRTHSYNDVLHRTFNIQTYKKEIKLTRKIYSFGFIAFIGDIQPTMNGKQRKAYNRKIKMFL